MLVFHKNGVAVQHFTKMSKNVVFDIQDKEPYSAREKTKIDLWNSLAKYPDSCSNFRTLIFQIVNHHLLKDLTERRLWNDDVKNKIIAHGGSIQVGQIF